IKERQNFGFCVDSTKKEKDTVGTHKQKYIWYSNA
ncbi:MAG: hypothetical protein ACI90V_012296, partial [Bacillariaceae sp.]